MSGDPAIWMLAAGFFAVALIYSSVGFGGGSSYTALLAIGGFAVASIPVLSLSCNLAVTLGGSLIFARKGLIRPSLIAPFVLPAMPAAYLGGRMPLTPRVYLLLLALSLAAAGVFLLIRTRRADTETRPCPTLPAMAIGGGLGLLSGMVGIGGGIFLSPILLITRWANPRESAVCASVFIALNSMTGLAGQLIKQPIAPEALNALPPLLLAVLAGGQIGSRLSAGILAPRLIRQGTACLLLLVSTRLILKVL